MVLRVLLMLVEVVAWSRIAVVVAAGDIVEVEVDTVASAAAVGIAIAAVQLRFAGCHIVSPPPPPSAAVRLQSHHQQSQQQHQ